MKWFKKKDAEVTQPKKRAKWQSLVNRLEVATDHTNLNPYQAPPNAYKAPSIPDGVAPDYDAMAMDGFCTASNYAGLDAQFYSSYLGYQALSQLAQSTEYRLVIETMAQEMTREWGEVKGEDQEKIDVIESELKRLGVRGLMRQAIEKDGYFGGAQLFISIKGQEEKTDLPLLINDKGIRKGSLKGFTVIEPMWTAPSMYNASDNTEPDFFVPSVWWAMGKQIHHSRLMTLITRPLPDMLKPAYNFYGIAMSQLMLPYVQRFQSVADSIAKVITMFSLTGLKTDMTAILQGDDDGVNQLVARLKTLALMRDNRGIVSMDKETEEFFQINTPLTSLPELLDKFTVMQAYPAQLPVIKIFGTPTAGLGNTSDGEFRAMYDGISAKQEAFLMPIMNKIIDIIQLNVWGEIDPDIQFKFNPLYQLDDNERADVNLKKAQTAQIYIQEGVIDNDEARQTLTEDEDSGYQLEGNAPEVDPYAEGDNANNP